MIYNAFFSKTFKVELKLTSKMGEYMSYKPKHCCQCGEKINRINRKPWSSPRFCELCETEFGIYDWLRRAFVAIGLVLGLFGIGSIFVKPEKPPVIAPNQFAFGNSNAKSEIANQTIAAQSLPNGAAQTKTVNGDSSVENKPRIAPAQTEPKKNQTENSSNDSSEAIYYCGAQTKKGTICTHRVKGGGRCWQHAGQPAMLPQSKLIAAQ